MALKQKKKWEAIVADAGYNDLIAAAYLAHAGLSIAVLERRHLMAALPLEEDDEQLEFDALEQLESPDLHVGSVRTIKLFTKIKELLNALDCPEKFSFNFADLLKPDTQRTEFFLGDLLNFCLDREMRLNSISEIVDEFNAVEVQRADLEENKILQLKSVIAECIEAREREMPFVQEVDAKAKELRQTIASLNNKQMSLRTTLNKSKDKTTEMGLPC